jgi:hypothetical protein
MNYYPKFGYQFDKNRKPIIDETSAQVVRRIFELIGEQNYPTTKVAEILNAEGAPTRSYYAVTVLKLKALHKAPATKWNAAKVWEVARDYEYCGHALNLKQHLKHEQLLLRNTHPAIINEELFFCAQKNLDRRFDGKEKIEHIGKLLVDRKTQGHLFYHRKISNSGNYAYYIYRRHNKQIYKITAKHMEEVLYKDIFNVIRICTDEQICKAIQPRLLKGSEYNLNILTASLRNQNEEYSALLEAYFIGKISGSTFRAKAIALQQKIEEIEKKISKAKDLEREIEFYKLKFLDYIKFLRDNPRNLISIIRLAIDKVYIDDVQDKNHFEITVVYNFNAK